MERALDLMNLVGEADVWPDDDFSDDGSVNWRGDVMPERLDEDEPKGGFKKAALMLAGAAFGSALVLWGVL